MKKEQPESNMEDGEKNPEKKAKVDLDTILVEELGQFGLYQLRMVILAVIVVIFGAWAAVEYIFTTARISTRSERRLKIFFSVAY